MHGTIALPFFAALAVPLALIASVAAAQTPKRPDPAAANPAPALEYKSEFEGYRPYVDPDLTPWRGVNDEMYRLGGHVGHVPGSAPPRAASPAKPPAAGERK